MVPAPRSRAPVHHPWAPRVQPAAAPPPWSAATRGAWMHDANNPHWDAPPLGGRPPPGTPHSPNMPAAEQRSRRTYTQAAAAATQPHTTCPPFPTHQKSTPCHPLRGR